MLANENKDISRAVEKLVYVSADDKERFRIDQIEQGAKEKTIEIAKSLLEKFDDQKISEVTGLKIEEVIELRKLIL